MPPPKMSQQILICVYQRVSNLEDVGGSFSPGNWSSTGFAHRIRLRMPFCKGVASDGARRSVTSRSLNQTYKVETSVGFLSMLSANLLNVFPCYEDLDGLHNNIPLLSYYLWSGSSESKLSPHQLVERFRRKRIDVGHSAPNAVLYINHTRIPPPSDPPLPVPPYPPFRITINGAPSLLNITSTTESFVSSYNLLPCLVSMLSDAFDAIWNKRDQSPELNAGYYFCQASTVRIYIATTNLRRPLRFPDLVDFANLIEAFQHDYALPEFRFQFLTNSVQRGYGYLRIVNVSSSTMESENLDLNATVQAAV